MRFNLFVATGALLAYAGAALSFSENEDKLAQFDNQFYDNDDLAQTYNSLKVASLVNKTPCKSCSGCKNTKNTCGSFKGKCGDCNSCDEGMSHADVSSNIKEVVDKHMAKGKSTKVVKCDTSKCKADQKMRQTLNKHKLQDAQDKKRAMEKKNAEAACTAKHAKVCKTCEKCEKCKAPEPCKKGNDSSAQLKALEVKINALSHKSKPEASKSANAAPAKTTKTAAPKVKIVKTPAAKATKPAKPVKAPKPVKPVKAPKKPVNAKAKVALAKVKAVAKVEKKVAATTPTPAAVVAAAVPAATPAPAAATPAPAAPVVVKKPTISKALLKTKKSVELTKLKQKAADAKIKTQQTKAAMKTKVEAKKLKAKAKAAPAKNDEAKAKDNDMKKDEFAFEQKVGKLVMEAKKSHLDLLVKSQQHIKKTCDEQKAAHAQKCDPRIAKAAPVVNSTPEATKAFMNSLTPESREIVAQLTELAMTATPANKAARNAALSKAIDEAK